MACTGINLEVRNYRCFSDAHPLKIKIENSDCISFIGVNNSGKSTALKFVYEFRQLFNALTQPEHWKHIVRRKKIEINLTGVLDQNDIFNFYNNGSIKIKFTFQYQAHTGNALNFIEFRLDRDSFNNHNPILDLESWDLTTGLGFHDKVENVLVDGKKITAKLNLNQIPVLDINTFDDYFDLLGKTIYIGAFRNAINTGTKDYFDLRVGTSFVEDWNIWKGGNNTSQNLQIMKVIKEIEELLDLKSLSIDSNDTRTSLKIAYDSKPYKLEDVGSGIAQIIVILGNILIKKPRLILIDEPELNLHPSLQLKFLKLLENHSECIMFSTHSVGLARTASTKIYAIKKEEEKSSMSSWEGVNNLVEFAGELSFSSLQDIGCNKILLVEGTSEVKCFQSLLRMAGKEKDFLILPLGGTSLISAGIEPVLHELKRLTDQIFCIVDCEKTSATDRLNSNISIFKQKCEESGARCHVLERRSFENYLDLPTVANFLNIDTGSLPSISHYDKFVSKIPNGWNKNNNWKIIQDMGLGKLRDTDLLKFIEEI